MVHLNTSSPWQSRVKTRILTDLFCRPAKSSWILIYHPAASKSLCLSIPLSLVKDVNCSYRYPVIFINCCKIDCTAAANGTTYRLGCTMCIWDLSNSTFLCSLLYLSAYRFVFNFFTFIISNTSFYYCFLCILLCIITIISIITALLLLL